MDTQLVSGLLAAAVIILISFPVHEFSHAWAAYMLGDSTARWQGRLTLDPRVHFDPLGSIILIVTLVLPSGFVIGWARPTPVNQYNLRYGRRGEALVAMSGPISNLAMAVAGALPLRLIWSDPALVATIQGSLVAGIAHNVLFMFVFINALLAVFNLLPIPPLDGWKILGGLLPARVAYQMRAVEQYGFLILLLLIIAGGRFLAPLIFGFTDLFVGDAGLIRLAGL